MLCFLALTIIGKVFVWFFVDVPQLCRDKNYLGILAFSFEPECLALFSLFWCVLSECAAASFLGSQSKGTEYLECL